MPQPSRGLFGIVMILLFSLGLFMLFQHVVGSRAQEATLEQLQTKIGNGDIKKDMVTIGEMRVEGAEESASGAIVWIVPLNRANALHDH